MSERSDVNHRGVIFDMDGVLVDSGPAHLKSWQMMAAEAGYQMTDDDFARTFGKTSREIMRELWDPQMTDDKVRRLDNRKEELYRDLIRGCVPVMPGALELMESLHRDGWRMAIGSSGPPLNVKLVVTELRLDRWLSATTDASEVTQGKPDPEVFLIAAGRMGVDPRRCVVIEDATHGITAAHRAGMKAVAITTTRPASAFPEADRVISALSELSPAGLAGLLGLPRQE